MAAHDVLYKYVEELTGEPVDTATFRPTFTGAMAALDTALRDSLVARENTISDALKEHMQSPHGNGGSSNTARVTMQVFPTEPEYIISLENMHVVIECANEVREFKAIGTVLQLVSSMCLPTDRSIRLLEKIFLIARIILLVKDLWVQ